MLHNLYNAGSFLKYMMPSSCLKTKTPHVYENISKRKQPGCFSFFSSFTPSPKARSYSTPSNKSSSIKSSNKLTPWGKAFNSLCSFIFGSNGTKKESPEDPKTPLLTIQNPSQTSFPSPTGEQVPPLPERLNNAPPPPSISSEPPLKSPKRFVSALITFATSESPVEMSSAAPMQRITIPTTSQNPVVLVVKPFDSLPAKTQPPINLKISSQKLPSLIPEETKSNQGAWLQEEDAPSSPSRPDLITLNEGTDSTTKTTNTQAQSPSDFLGFISGGANQILNDVVSVANVTAGFASRLITDITNAPLTRLDLDIVSTTNPEKDIFEIKAFNFINEELELYNTIQLVSADEKINCYNLIISIINKNHIFFKEAITLYKKINISPFVTALDPLTHREMIDLFDQMNREKSIVAEDDDEKVKQLKIIMKILPVYLKGRQLNIKELLEEKTWPKPNSITINDELKLKALKYINEVSGSNLDISEADQTNNFDYLMSIIQGKSKEIKKAIYNPHNPRQLASDDSEKDSDDSEMDRESKIHLYNYLNQRLKIYTIDDDDRVQKFNLIARCIKLKRTDALTLMARDGYNKVAEITEASKDKLLYTLQEAIDPEEGDLVSEELNELNDSEAVQMANKIVSEALNSEVVEEASKAIGNINRVAASGVKDVETKAIEAGHAVVIGGLDGLIYASDALAAVDRALASEVKKFTRALDDEELPQEEDLRETSNGLSPSNGPITNKENGDNVLENEIVPATQAAHSALSDALSTFGRHFQRLQEFTVLIPSKSPKPGSSAELSGVPRTSDSAVVSDDLKFKAFQYINDVCKIEFTTTEITREENKEFIDYFDYMIRNANDDQRKILQEEDTNTPIQSRSYPKSLKDEEKNLLFDYLNRYLNLGIITDDKSVKVNRFDAFVDSYENKERREKFKVDFYIIRKEKNNAQVTRENPLRGLWGLGGR